MQGTWKWRRPTATGLAILCVLAVIEGILLFYLFLPSVSDSDHHWVFQVATSLVGFLFLVCASILLTEKTRV